MLVKINSLSIQIDNNCILKQFNKEISPSLNLIYGGNGQGKTTLLNLLENPQCSQGHIQLIDISKISFFQLQSLGLYDEMSCSQILDLYCSEKSQSLLQNKIYYSQIFQKSLSLKSNELSNGMRQVFKYYLHTFWNPELILMDEPFSFLDPVNKGLLTEDLIERKKSSIIFITAQTKLEEIKEIDLRLELSLNA